MEADGYAAGTRHGYGKALASFAAWLACESPDALATIEAWLTGLLDDDVEFDTDALHDILQAAVDEVDRLACAPPLTRGPS